MDYLRIQEHPKLRSPLLVASFEGWSDASEVASWSTRFLVRQWEARKFAEVDPEEFFVFTERRPDVKWIEKERRTIIWPGNNFHYRVDPDRERDFIILTGIEPHLKWKTFVSAVMQLIAQEDVYAVLSLGGVLASVPHTQPARLTGTATDPDFMEHLADLRTPGGRYEGPTGIMSVLTSRLQEEGIPFASLWGSVPHYLSARPNVRVSLAMLQQLDRALKLNLDLRRVERRADEFDRQVNQAVSGNSEINSYVRKLEEETGRAGVEEAPVPQGELPSGESIVQELEEFLRRHQGGVEGEEKP